MFNYARMHAPFEFWVAASGKADFSKTRFQNTAQLRGDYHTAGIFNYATFEGPVIFWNSTFAGKAEFLATTFQDRLDASHTTFAVFTRCCETTFDGAVNLHATRFTDRVHFRRLDAASTSIDLTPPTAN